MDTSISVRIAKNNYGTRQEERKHRLRGRNRKQQTMKTIQGSIRAVIGTVLTCGMIQCASAIEGLQLFLQCSNVVLTWPSVDGDSYIVRRRADLSTNSSWTCLTNSYPATSGTNITVFTDYGIVSNANCSGSGGAPLAMHMSTMLTTSQTSGSKLKKTSTLAPPPSHHSRPVWNIQRRRMVPRSRLRRLQASRSPNQGAHSRQMIAVGSLRFPDLSPTLPPMMQAPTPHPPMLNFMRSSKWVFISSASPTAWC